MPEDSWLRCERQYFVDTYALKLEIPAKKLNDAIEEYNKFLQKALILESPVVAEDLALTIIKSRGEISDSE